MNPELSKHMAIIAGSRAGGRAIASLVRKGRGDVDCDSMGYDEVRGSTDSGSGVLSMITFSHNVLRLVLQGP